FGRTQILAVGRHVPAALQHLANELIASLPARYAVERRASLASLIAQTVAGAALLVLQHQRALQLERRAALDVADRRRGGGPGFHLRRPRDRHTEAGQRRDRENDHEHRENSDRTALPALFSG